MNSSRGDSISAELDLTPDSQDTGVTLNASGSGPRGSWTATEAPEIDPASAASGLPLLFGGILVLRSRKQQDATA
jgi:hypothetical protein